METIVISIVVVVFLVVEIKRKPRQKKSWVNLSNTDEVGRRN